MYFGNFFIIDFVVNIHNVILLQNAFIFVLTFMALRFWLKYQVAILLDIEGLDFNINDRTKLSWVKNIPSIFN